MDERTPSWGITPVPERLRVLGLFDTTLLWGNLSISLLVIVAAAGLVPALSFKQALLAILIGSVVGNILLGLAGMIGADARVPGMVLLRAPLGRRGSYAPTVVNVAQNLGWSTFELIIISTAAAALSQRVFGFEARWAWALLARPAQRVPRRRDRLLRPHALVLRARRGARARARAQRDVADPDRGRFRERACGHCAADADRGRERRGVRGHLLDRDLGAER